MSDADLLGAVVRRLVHDVANPLAAAQLLAEDGDPLLRQSILRVADLLAFYRAVFGGEPDDAIDDAALGRRLADAIAPATLAMAVAPGAPARAMKAGAALVLATAGRGPARLAIAADGAIHLAVERPREAGSDAALRFAERLCGPFRRESAAAAIVFSSAPA